MHADLLAKAVTAKGITVRTDVVLSCFLLYALSSLRGDGRRSTSGEGEERTSGSSCACSPSRRSITALHFGYESESAIRSHMSVLQVVVAGLDEGGPRPGWRSRAIPTTRGWSCTGGRGRGAGWPRACTDPAQEAARRARACAVADWSARSLDASAQKRVDALAPGGEPLRGESTPWVTSQRAALSWSV